MGKGFKHGASGGKGIDLNFTVQAYPSDVELNTATPAENTVGVVTTNPIRGWYFSATQPETPAEGEVWFSVGASSPAAFNAVNGNTIMVYPFSAKQYVSGAWVEVKAKAYQGGKWVDLLNYLFNKGDDCVALSGGWSGAWTNANGCFHIDATGNKTWYPEWTKKKYDLTKAKTLTIKYEVTETGGTLQFSMRMGLMSTEPTSIALSSAPTYVSSVVCNETEKQAVLDVSSVTGEYYVVFTNPASMNTTKTNVYEVIVE